MKRVPGVATSIATPLNMRIDESISGTSGALTGKVFGTNLQTPVQKGAEVRRVVEKVAGVLDVRLEPLEGVPQVVIAEAASVRPASA